MRQKTETMLCAAFMELLKKCPFSKITIQKLAGQCGVNRQTFYYHFDNIYDLMSKAFEYELVHESHIYEEVTWEYAMSRFLQWIKDNRVIISKYFNKCRAAIFKKSYVSADCKEYILWVFFKKYRGVFREKAGRILQ